MPTDWKTPHQAAMREQDPAKLPDLCEKARRAIFERLTDSTRNFADEIEREELDQASRELTLREKH
jgi:hypothetical protein